MGKSFVLTATAMTIFVSSAGASTAQVVFSEPETVAYASGETPSFFAMTPAKVGLIGGLVGGVVMYATGAELIKKNGVPDPSADMARDLAQRLAERRMARLAGQPILTNVKKPTAVAAAGAGAQYVLTVQTTNWGHLYYPLDWARYSVFYNAKMQVIDVPTRTVIHGELCSWRSPKPGSPTRAELLRNNAEGLKAFVATAADVCFHQFERGLDKIAPPASRSTDRTLAANLNAGLAPAVTPSPEDQPVSPMPAAMATLVESRLPLPPVTPVAPPEAVSLSFLPPARNETSAEPLAVAATGVTTVAPRSLAPVVQAPAVEIAQTERPVAQAQPLPPYVEYPYARPHEAPPSRKPPPPEYRYAGRDADGFLTWPGKRP